MQTVAQWAVEKGQGPAKRGLPMEQGMEENPPVQPQPKRQSPFHPEGTRFRVPLRPQSNQKVLPTTSLQHPPPQCPSDTDKLYVPPDLRRDTADWAEPSVTWDNMISKTDKPIFGRKKASEVFGRIHPDLNHARIRAILLDWLIDVCEVYKLHRETFYLATDYLDRYLSRTKNFQRTQLQLLGITTLFAAAKLEEIYPPKCEEFAYVTDQACTEEEIRSMEITLLQVLDWQLAPVTALQWLKLFLQHLHLPEDQAAKDGPDPVSVGAMEGMTIPGGAFMAAGLPKDPNCILKTHFRRQDFLACAKLLDSMLIQEEWMEIPYPLSAGAVLATLVEMEQDDAVAYVARRCGLPQSELARVTTFLAPTIQALSTPHSVPTEIAHTRIPRQLNWEDIPPDDVHNIQTREASLALYDHIQTRKLIARTLSSPAPTFPTPPPSDERRSAPSPQAIYPNTASANGYYNHGY